MIDATKETDWMVRLGGYHYDKRNFDLALKYNEMADELGDNWYRDVDDFFAKAVIGEERVPVLYRQSYGFKVV